MPLYAIQLIMIFILQLCLIKLFSFSIDSIIKVHYNYFKLIKVINENNYSTY
jgi:hypothetical protein